MNKIVYWALSLVVGAVAMAPVVATDLGNWLIDQSDPVRLVAGGVMLLWALPMLVIGDTCRPRVHRWLASRWPRLGPEIDRRIFRSAAIKRANGAP